MYKRENLAQFAKRWYQTIRKPIVVILVITTFTASYLDIPIAKDAALLGATLILIELLFDIQSRLRHEKSLVSFVRFHYAALHFREQVEQRAVSGKLLRI